MSDSKKLPTIEVGDTVVFRTDLVEGNEYGIDSFIPDMVNFVKQNQVVGKVFDGYFLVEDGGGWNFTPEMVKEVIKLERKIDSCGHFDIETGCDLDECKCEKEEVLKPSKARVYSAEDIKKAIEFGCQQGHERGYINLVEEVRFFESLNTEGK